MTTGPHEPIDAKATRLQGALETVQRAAGSVPGWSAAFIDPTGTVTTATLGQADAHTGAPVEESTLFPAVSTIKIATAMLAGRLQFDGKIDLDAGLFTAIGRASDSKQDQPTLRQAIGNCSGLDNALPAEDATLEQAAALASEVPRLGAPGQRFAYSNAAFIAAGYACERAADMPFHEALRELVPSVVDGWLHADTVEALVSAGAASPHDANGEPIEHYVVPGARPTGLGSWATARGLAGLGRALLDDARLSDLLHAPQVAMPDPRMWHAWNHGFATHGHGDEQLHGWDGVVMGSKAWLRWSREGRWAVALMANGPAPWRSIDVLLEAMDPSICARAAEPSALDATACCGRYGSMTVEHREERLWARGALTGGAEVPLSGNLEAGLWMPTPLFGDFPVAFAEVEGSVPTSLYIAPMLWRRG